MIFFLWNIKCLVLVLDSYGKLNPGINLGNHQHLGRYHDCRNIYVPRGQNRPYQAAYCRATFQVPVPESAAIVSDQCLGIPLENGIGEPLFYNRVKIIWNKGKKFFNVKNLKRVNFLELWAKTKLCQNEIWYLCSEHLQH